MKQDRVMLLIDADNVSVDVMEQVVSALIATHGALHVRRAYGTAESAVQNQAVFKRLGIKPMVNLAAGKNSTDIALAVDAIDLVLAERPDVVAIASSDSDFAPLVTRLREKGCRVVGFGQDGKTGDETQQVYDAYTVLAHRKAAPAARKTPARKTAVKKAAAAAPAPTRAAAAAAVPLRAPPAPAARPAPVQAIVDAVPELAQGRFVALNIVAEALRAARLLGKSASSTKLLRQFAGHFELEPEKKPDRVRLRGH